MSENAVDRVLKGKVIGYCENLKSSASMVKALIQIDSKVIGINIGFLQYEYISHDNPIGSIVEIKFQDGEWFIENRCVSDRPYIKAGADSLKALKLAAGTFKGRSGPADGESQAGRIDVDSDLEFIKNSVGTIDMGVEYDDDYNIRMIETKYLEETDVMLERIDMSYLRMVPPRKQLKAIVN